MKILFAMPGHLKTVPMNRYVVGGLRGLGIEVEVFNYRRRLMSHRFMNQYLKIRVTRSKPDLFLTLFGFDLDVEVLRFTRRKNIVSVCWWLNDPFQLERSLTKAGFYDFYFTNALGCIDQYKKKGIKKVFFLPLACDPEVHKKVELSEVERRRFESDICFAGDWGPTREKILTELSRDFDLKIWGPWKKRISKDSALRSHLQGGFFTPEEMVKIFNASKIILNIHSWFGKWDYGINPRVFEAPGCGGFQLCDWKMEIPELYKVDSEIACYTSIDELREKLSFFLGNENERQRIQQMGYKKTHEQHTYVHRLREMLNICSSS